MEGGSEPRSVPPFPVHWLHPADPADPADPDHPAESSKFGFFDGRVVILGLDGALA